MLANWVKATTTTTGTGSVTLSAVSDYPRPSDVFATGAFVQYVINTSDGKHESGIGKVAASNALERTSVLSTFSSGTYNNTTATAISLASGTHEVLVTPLAEHILRSPAFPLTNTSVSNRNVVSSNLSSVPANVSIAAASQRPTAYPFSLAVGGLLTGFSMNVSTAGAGSSTHVGLYVSSETGHPGRLIAKTSSAIDTSSTGYKTQSSVANARVNPGQYWIAIVVTAGTVPTCTGAMTSCTHAGNSTQSSIINVRYDSAATDLSDTFQTTSIVFSAVTSTAPYLGVLLA